MKPATLYDHVHGVAHLIERWTERDEADPLRARRAVLACGSADPFTGPRNWCVTGAASLGYCRFRDHRAMPRCGPCAEALPEAPAGG